MVHVQCAQTLAQRDWILETLTASLVANKKKWVPSSSLSDCQSNMLWSPVSSLPGPVSHTTVNSRTFTLFAECERKSIWEIGYWDSSLHWEFNSWLFCATKVISVIYASDRHPQPAESAGVTTVASTGSAEESRSCGTPTVNTELPMDPSTCASNKNSITIAE